MTPREAGALRDALRALYGPVLGVLADPGRAWGWLREPPAAAFGVSRILLDAADALSLTPCDEDSDLEAARRLLDIRDAAALLLRLLPPEGPVWTGAGVVEDHGPLERLCAPPVGVGVADQALAWLGSSGLLGAAAAVHAHLSGA